MTDEKKTPLLDFSKIVAPRRPNVEANMYAGQEFTPEAAAVGVRAQRDHGIPASMAAADNTMVPTPKLDFSAINKSKPLANYASTPAGAAVIRDDITGLSALDDVLRAFGRDFRQQMEILSDTGTAIKSGLARSDANIYGFLAAPFGVAGQAADPLVGKVIPNNPFSEGESFLLGKSKEMAGFADAQLAPVLAKQKGYAKDAMEGLASLFPSATGMALAAVTKNPALAYGVAGAQSGGAGYAQARQEGLSPLDSMMYGTNAGMISAVSEMIPAIKYVEDMAAGTKLHKVIVGQLATEMPGEQFDAHMGDLNEWAYLNPDKTLAEYAAERPDVAIKTMVATIAATVAQTAAVSTTASVVTEVGEMKKRRDVATRAEAAQKSVKAMAEHIKATKMLGRDPDGLAGLVTQIAEEGGAPSTVYIDAADLTGVLLQSNMTIHDMAELIPAVGPQMVDAFMAGGTVEIPVGEALVRLSGTAIEEAMMPHIRLEADGYSAEQAKKFVAEYEGQQMAKAEGILKKFAEDSEFRQSAARIRRQVQDELTAIDPASPESAATRAKLFEAFFVTAARDWGGEMTPGKLFDRLYKGRPVVVGRDSQQAGGADLTQPSDRSVDVGYDIATPQFTNGVIKKMGGKVETIEAGDKFLGFRINDQMRDQVAAGQALFQPDNGQAMPRGTFRPSDLLMTLSKTRNASTFLHEAGHGFLDMTMMMAQMPDAPKEIQKRADDILAWMGITGTPEMSARETWMNMTLDEKRPYHEKWAETFEAYLMRGESPSLELSEAFSKFRDWLVSIYKTITEAIKTGKLPNASLNREVINIMDRLLATDQQIAEARAARAVIPLFTSKPEGMTVEAWREYQAQVGAQDAHDKHVIDRKKLSDMQWVRTKGGKLLKELQKAAAEKRKEMKIRARAAIMSQPAYIARKILTSRVAKEKLVKEKDSKYSKDIDLSRDSAMIAIAKAGGMNEALFVAEYGIDPADFKTPEMRAGHKRPVMVKRGGLRPGDVGEMLAELGYIPVDADGKFENQAVEDLLDDEARGNPRYSYEADYGKIYAGDAYSETQQPDINSIETLAARLHRDEMHQFRFIDGIEKLAPMIADRGYPAEALAGMVGFESGEQMIRALIETKDINIAIEELTDKLMLDKYGDLSSPEALQRAVDEAMAGPARLRFLATEISIAEKSTGNRQNIYRAAKEAARNILSGIKVSAVRPDKYRVAATRASREAAAALGRGESDAVVKNKRTEALNTALFMEASSARDEIKKKLTSFRKKLKGKDEDIAKTRNMDLVNVARTILSDFGMLSEAGVARSGKAMDILKQYNPEIAQVFEDIVNDLPPAKNYKDLTLAEFRAVVQTVEAVLHRARQEKRILIEGQQYDMDEFAATVVGKLGQAGAVPAVMESTLSTKDRMVRFTMGALAHLRRAESFLELASGLDIDIFRPVNNAIQRHFQSSNGYLKEMTELLDSIKKDLSSFPIVALPGELGPKGFKFNKGKLEILHVILHMGNDSNKGKLVLGRNWGSNPDGTPDFSGLDRFIARMIDEGVITKNDMDFVQSVWDLMEKMKPDAQKAHKDMFGFHFDEITASPIVTKFGVYRGGYVPAIGDRTSALVAQRAAANELYDAGSGKMFPTTGRGFAKSRVKWDVPLELNIGLLTSHIDSVSRFTYVEPTVREIARLLNRGDVSNAFVSYHPQSLQNIINPWLESSAKQTIAPPSATPETDAAINWMNSTAGASMMAGNIANVIQQFTGFGFAAIKVRPDYLMRALFTTTRQPVSLRRNIANLDPFMKERLEGNQFELQRHIRAVVTGNGPLDTVKKGDDWIKAHAYFAQLWAQRILDPIIWQAAYDQAVSKGSADPVGDAGAAVRNTQGSFGAEDLSNIEKGSAWWRVSMKFYSYFSMQINTMTTESAKEVREKGFVRAVPRLAYMWFIVYAVTNMVAEGIMTGFPGGDDDDDEDGIFDEWMAMYFGASFRVGTASVPGVGAAAAAVAGSFDDQPFNDRLNVSPLSSYLSRALKGGIELFVPEEEGDEEFTVSEMKSLMALFGIMGLPTGQVGKTAGYVMQVEDGAIEPETEFDYLIGLARGR